MQNFKGKHEQTRKKGHSCIKMWKNTKKKKKRTHNTKGNTQVQPD